MTKRVLILCAAVLTQDLGTAFSTTVIPIGFDDLVAKAELIFVGQVIDRRSTYVSGPDRAIVTDVTFDVLRVLKGSAGLRTRLTFLGGRVGSDALIVSGMPQFDIGDRDMLFVSDRIAASPLVGFWQGRFRVIRDPDTGREVIRTHGGGAVFNGLAQPGTSAPLRAGAVVGARGDSSLSLDDFETLVRGRVGTAAGR